MRKAKPSRNQISLIGEIYNYNLKYSPHVSTREDTGETVVVLHIPVGADPLDIIASRTEQHRLATEYKTHFKKDFWIDKARDDRRKRGLTEIDDDFTT